MNPLSSVLDAADREILALRAELAALRAQVAETDELDDGDRAAYSWTYSGGGVHLLDPRSSEMNIVDIARGLATKFRYNGHTIEPYTVAEHSIIVSLYVAPEHARQALMHDAAEAYIGDMCRPLKYRPKMRAFRDAEARIEAAIFERFGIVPTPESTADVKRIDDRILVDETTQLIRGVETNPIANLEQVRAKYGPALGTTISCLTPLDAEYIFVSRFIELFPEQFIR